MVPALREQHERFKAARERMFAAAKDDDNRRLQAEQRRREETLRLVTERQHTERRERRLAKAARIIEAAAEAKRNRAEAMSNRPISSIVDLVSEITGVEIKEIVSERRVAPATKARQIAMWLIRRYTPASYPRAGRALGDRDHTTVLHGIRRVDAVIARIGAPPADNPQSWALHLWEAEWPRPCRR
jgi:chromosomal replication initiation ATPase DnaA